VLAVEAEPARYGREVTLRVANRGQEPAALRGEVLLEREGPDGFAPLDDVALDLRYACGEAAPECVTLAPGATYIPPPWLGRQGDAQCGCEGCAPAPAGTYRFVVQSCDGAHRVEGAPFDVPPEPPPLSATPR
jgi:hypothetical protein